MLHANRLDFFEVDTYEPVSTGASTSDANFEAAFDRLFRIGYSAGYRILRSREDSEDVAIEALARGSVKWRRISGYSEAWISRVSTNLALDILRHKKRSPELAVVISSQLPVGERIDLLAAIEKLPRRQRMTISLRYLSGLSEKETAQVLNCSIGTVKTQTSCGLKAIRESLGGDEWRVEHK